MKSPQLPKTKYRLRLCLEHYEYVSDDWVPDRGYTIKKSKNKDGMKYLYQCIQSLIRPPYTQCPTIYF